MAAALLYAIIDYVEQEEMGRDMLIADLTLACFAVNFPSAGKTGCGSTGGSVPYGLPLNQGHACISFVLLTLKLKRCGILTATDGRKNVGQC
ncbi:hypothetical protein M514_06057 [Trichuris suis]|uniref:Uncharacterized protein n=1 Tax=Trichuris suis TaxID=68888 RepID=A0A085M7E7_9BILA|nr:hypothetical protein M513_06057 [Trichuris suis]KFD70709.1 hypothetical protein M514_06057 [Trichuris suis]